MAELLGTRRGSSLLRSRTSQNFVYLLSTEGECFPYLYSNADDYDRGIQSATEHDGHYQSIEFDLFLTWIADDGEGSLGPSSSPGGSWYSRPAPETAAEWRLRA